MAKTPDTKISTVTTVTPSQLKAMIGHCVARKRPLMIAGPPGIGKSDVVAWVARQQNRPLIDIRLPLLEATDIRGLPHLAEVTIRDADGNIVYNEQNVPLTEKVFKWSNPTDMPTDPNSRALVFFDEMSAAPPSVQAATYQVVLNRRIGNYQLPDDVVIVAAGNRVKDRGVAYNMPSPLQNRFIHATLQVDFDDWQEWAMENRIHKDVVGYLSFQPNDLFDFDPRRESYAFATPRSWSFVSELLYEPNHDGTYRDTDLPVDILGNLIKGTIGEGPAIKFMTYRKQAANLPRARDVLTGKVTKLNVKQVDIMYALTTALVYELVDDVKKAEEVRRSGKKNSHDEVYTSVDNFLKFCMDNFEDEMVVMAAREFLKQTRDTPVKPRELKMWKPFIGKFSALIPSMGI
jgi:ATPase family associated with various cellular activities (AAA)